MLLIDSPLVMKMEKDLSRFSVMCICPHLYLCTIRIYVFHLAKRIPTHTHDRQTDGRKHVRLDFHFAFFLR